MIRDPERKPFVLTFEEATAQYDKLEATENRILLRYARRKGGVIVFQSHTNQEESSRPREYIYLSTTTGTGSGVWYERTPDGLFHAMPDGMDLGLIEATAVVPRDKFFIFPQNALQ